MAILALPSPRFVAFQAMLMLRPVPVLEAKFPLDRVLPMLPSGAPWAPQ